MELVLKKRRLKIIPKVGETFGDIDTLDEVYIEKALGLESEGDRISLVRRNSINGSIILRTEKDTKLNAVEALFGFCSWLTSRKKAVTLSSTHDAGVTIDLMEEFCKANGLDMDNVRRNWTDYLTHPASPPVEAVDPKPKEPLRDYNKEEEDRLLKLLKEHNKKTGGDPNIIEQSEVDAMLNSLDGETTKKEEKPVTCTCGGKCKSKDLVDEVIKFDVPKIKKNWEKRCYEY